MVSEIEYISATRTTSGPAAITGNDVNKERSVCVISSPPSSPHFAVALIYGSVTVAR